MVSKLKRKYWRVLNFKSVGYNIIFFPHAQAPPSFASFLSDVFTYSCSPTLPSHCGTFPFPFSPNFDTVQKVLGREAGIESQGAGVSHPHWGQKVGDHEGQSVSHTEPQSDALQSYPWCDPVFSLPCCENSEDFSVCRHHGEGARAVWLPRAETLVGRERILGLRLFYLWLPAVDECWIFV